MSFAFPASAPVRPIWLITLADLALLLVGFFVLLQVNQKLDRAALARGMREGFAAEQPAAAPIALAANGMGGFTPGSAALPRAPEALVTWARAAARDPRVSFTITGQATTDEGLRLAFERAGAVATALLDARATTPDRLILRATSSSRRAVTITLGFSGPNR